MCTAACCVHYCVLFSSVCFVLLITWIVVFFRAMSLALGFLSVLDFMFQRQGCSRYTAMGLETSSTQTQARLLHDSLTATGVLTHTGTPQRLRSCPGSLPCMDHQGVYEVTHSAKAQPRHDSGRQLPLSTPSPVVWTPLYVQYNKVLVVISVDYFISTYQQLL